MKRKNWEQNTLQSERFDEESFCDGKDIGKGIGGREPIDREANNQHVTTKPTKKEEFPYAIGYE